MEGHNAVKSFGCLFVGCLLGIHASSGGFTGGACGSYGHICAGYGLAVLAVACGLGTFFALRGVAQVQTRSWVDWLALVVNGIPALSLWYLVIAIFA